MVLTGLLQNLQQQLSAIDGSTVNLGGIAALANDELQATAVAQKINENTGVHGVKATSFNEITTNTGAYSGAAVTYQRYNNYCFRL